MHTERKTTETSKTVDEGIALCDQVGTIKAAAFMIDRGVRFPVVVRVLDPEARRRPTSTPQSPPPAAPRT